MHSQNEFESREKRFRLFQNIIFEADNESSLVQTQFFERNLKATRYAAFIVMITGLYWLFVDISKAGALKLSSGPALYVIIAKIIFSIYMLLLPKLSKNKNEKLVQYSFLVYYIILITAVTALSVTKNAVTVANGNFIADVGISLSTFYLFIIMIVPLPSKRDSFIIGAYFLVMQIVPVFLPGHEIYNIRQQTILSVCLIIAYWYMRNVNLALSDSMQRLSVMSFTDPLTKTLNRRALDTYWNDICTTKNASTVGIFILDIDDFKKYNDYYSHVKGDEVLKHICDVVVNALQQKNEFLFRYGGEEFVILTLDHTDDEILNFGEKICGAVYDANIERDDGTTYDRVTVTIGCAQESINKADIDYISSADLQLYIGKNGGKKCVVYDGTIYR